MSALWVTIVPNLRADLGLLPSVGLVVCLAAVAWLIGSWIGRKVLK